MFVVCSKQKLIFYFFSEFPDIGFVKNKLPLFIYESDNYTDI